MKRVKEAVGRYERIFANRLLFIATLHQKDRVIAPLMKKELSIVSQVAAIDTNQFGTFSGTVPRKKSPLESARLKCLEVKKTFPTADLVLASEGSFGPHPFIPFVAGNEELILLKDFTNSHEWVVKELSTDTNFAAEAIESIEKGINFASKIGFPEHGLTIKKTAESVEVLHQEITDWEELNTVLNRMFAEYNHLWMETDMRAHRNPTRMGVIKNAAIKLIRQLQSTCPSCDFPGFKVVDAIRGLPCQLCNQPTSAPLAHLYKCEYCAHESQMMHPNNKTHQDPMYCDFCNP